MPFSRRIPQASLPVDRYFPSDRLVVGAGVVIFHLATERVVLCRHSVDKSWFLPKGRRDASEEIGTTACREGYEESGYRNRLLPLPIPHIQPRPLGHQQPFDTEPIATRLMPVAKDKQYLLFWYAAETIPESLETSLNAIETPSAPTIAETSRGVQVQTGDGDVVKAFVMPEPFPKDMSLKQRIQMDKKEDGKGVYEPKRHEGTGVDEEEALYESYLVSVPEASRLLGSSTSRDVVERAWEGVKLRLKMEEGG